MKRTRYTVPSRSSVISGLRSLLAPSFMLLGAAAGLGPAACGGKSSKDSAMSTSSQDASPDAGGAAPTSSGAPDAAAAPSNVPVARSRAELAQHEGQPIRVEGTFRFPIEQAFARNKLVLDDGTEVILPRPSSGPGAAELVLANSGARLAALGVVYIKDIPAKYKIIGRTPDPYLVELTAVELIK